MGWYLELIALVLFFLIVYKGYENGVVLSVIGIITFFGSYFLSYILAAPVGMALHEATGIYRFVAVPVGGLLVFIIINFLSFFPKFIYKRIMRTKIEDDEGNVKTFYKPHIASRVVGICLMLPVALFMVSFMYWASNAVFPDEAGVKNSIMAYPAKKLIGLGMSSVLNNQDQDIYSPEQLTELITNPAEAAGKVNDVLHEPAIQRLVQDQSLLEVLRAGDPEAISRNRSLSMLLNDDEDDGGEKG